MAENKQLNISDAYGKGDVFLTPDEYLDFKIAQMSDCVEKQKDFVFNQGNKDLYNIGLLNGLILGLSMLKNEKPAFYPDCK